MTLVLAIVSCAHSSGPRPVNVHSVRVAIKGQIEVAPGSAGPRTILSMGRVSADAAGFPILRSGRVASYPLAPASVFPTFLMDFSVFPGNSGGAVFMAQGARR